MLQKLTLTRLGSLSSFLQEAAYRVLDEYDRTEVVVVTTLIFFAADD